MSQLSRICAAAALVAGALSAGQAVAGPVCVSCTYTGDTYLGQHNPTLTEGAGFNHDFGSWVSFPNTAFTDVFVFDIAPSGNFQMNASFQRANPAGISGFKVELFSTIGTPTCGALGASCSGVAFGGLPIATTTPGLPLTSATFFMPTQTLTAGWYALVVSGTVLNGTGTRKYSGQIDTEPTPMPEPGSLALAGLALLGVAAGVRRSRAA